MEPKTDPRDGAADRAGRDSSVATLEPTGAAAAPVPDVPLPEPRQRWHHYQLGELIPGGPGRCFNAVDTSGGGAVVIRVTQIGPGTEVRRNTWVSLTDLHQSWMVELIEAQEEYGLRYEVSRIPEPMTLRMWAAQRTVGLPDFEALVRQLSGMLQTLHKSGIVHLNLRPDTLHVASAEGDLQIGLGGMEFATLYEQSNPIPIPFDPLYSPPEASGLELQPPGRSLCTWDWWSMGRVVQEFVIGRHIYGDLLQCDVNSSERETRSQIEALLNESGEYQVRAGAVELMPAMYNSQVSLLRGLLTTVRDGRWGFHEVQRWLDKKPVKDRYDSPRGERFFARPDGVYTIAEAAEYFAQEPNWKEGEDNLFDADDPQTLAYFIASDAANIDLYERLTGLFDLGGIPEWSKLPRTATQTALAGGAWAILAGPKVGLVLRGRRVTHHDLLARMGEGNDSPALVRAMLAPPYVAEVQKADPEAGQMLSEVAALYAEVLEKGIKGGWVDAGDEAASSRLLGLALESPIALADARRRVRARFACTRNQAAKDLIEAAEKEDRCSLILLAYAESCPERFGFVTQESLDNERCADLRKRAQQLATALFWFRLRQVLASNPSVFGRPRILAASWLGLAAFAWRAGLLSNAHNWIALFILVPPLLRVVHCAGLRRLLPRHAPSARRWTWNDGAGRCSEELPAAMGGAAVPSEDRIILQLAVLKRKIAEVPLKQTPRPVDLPGRLPALWTTSVVSWLIMVLVLGSALRVGVHRFRVEGWRFIGFGGGTAFTPVSDDADVKLHAVNPDWSFADPRNQRVAWNLQPHLAAPAIAVEKTLAASPDQVAFALVEGERELLSFLRRTVKPLIAVQVPTEAGTGLILFDGQEGTVAERKIYLVGQLPPAPCWLKLAGRDVVFLGTAKQAAAQPDADADVPEPGVP